MSFFFDVWTSEGFVLASDVRLVVDGTPTFAHKLARPPASSPARCAMAVCGEYPGCSITFFHEAVSRHDRLRDIAHAFAERWTERYGGTHEYSAVHIAGFDDVPGTDLVIPQVWFWSNWSGTDFPAAEHFESELRTFSRPIPSNSHIPHKIREVTGRFPDPTPESEAAMVSEFLALVEPHFTWNGDVAFWHSAASIVGSAMNLLRTRKPSWPVDDTAVLAMEAIRFLVQVGTLLQDSTVALSPDLECDVLAVTRDEVRRITSAYLPETECWNTRNTGVNSKHRGQLDT